MMKKQIWKKIIAVVMVSIILFTTASCGQTADRKQEDTGEMIYEGTPLALEGVDAEINLFTVMNDRIYFLTYPWKLYSVNLDGSDLKEIPFALSENDYPDRIMAGKDGTLTILLHTYDEQTEQAADILIRIDENGKELAKEDVTKTMKFDDGSYLVSMLLDSKGRVIAVTDNGVCILDENFKPAGEVKTKNKLESAALTKDGKIVCALRLKESQPVQIQELDVDKKSWKNTYKLEGSNLAGSEALINGSDYDFYYRTDSGIYGYNIEGETSDKIIDYMASNITSEAADKIVPVGDGKLIGVSYESQKTNLVIYKKADSSAITDKVTITYATLCNNQDVEKAVVEYNRTSKKYRIELKNYSEEEEPEAKMNADIVAGNVPDIINLNYDASEYIAKGIFEDLTPYFDNDPEISTGDILDSVLESIKVDDKIYYVTPNFFLYSLVGRTKDVGNGTGWTFDELKALLAEKGEEIKPFYCENKLNMLSEFLENGLNDFVNWQTGECSFDSQDFKDILEICNNRGSNENTDWSDDSPSMPSQIQEGRVLFYADWVSPTDIQLLRKVFNEDITYIGYPNKEKQGSYFVFPNMFGIYANSKVKDGAWDFIRTFMTKEYQGKTSPFGYHAPPTRKDCFDMMMKSVTATEKYTDELGRVVMPLSDSVGWNGFETEIKPLSQEEADIYINLITNTKKNGRCNEHMMDIITDEAGPYFAGEKDLEETVNIIQNRIKTYVNECH